MLKVSSSESQSAQFPTEYFYPTILSDVLERSYQESVTHITESLQKSGIHFEGKEIPVSIHPTILKKMDLEMIANDLKNIREALLRVIARYVEEINTEGLGGKLARFFAPYQRWAKFIAEESRKTEAIHLMRYDAVGSLRDGWKIFETNTCCPGGVIHCARIRESWITTRMAKDLLKNHIVASYPIDDPTSFVQYLYSIQTRCQSSSDLGAIAICSYQGNYMNEVESLRREYARLVSANQIDGNEIILCDLREIECTGKAAYVRGRKVSLIYNKIDQLTIDPNAPEVRGWVLASKSDEVEFLNSLGAMYLTEAKRILALLSDPTWQVELGLDDTIRQSIAKVVPETELLSEPKDPSVVRVSLLDQLFENPSLYVLKADSLTRGSGIWIGRQVPKDQWANAILTTLKYHGVVQRAVDIPDRSSYRLVHSMLKPTREYYGVDFFFFGDRFVGPVSRASENMVFNVGNGGRESPTIVIDTIT